MLSFLAFVHLIVATLLVVFVLLQDSKGGAMGVFGGASSKSVFGSTGGVTFLAKLTAGLAITFAVTCITLAYMTSAQYLSGGSVFEGGVPKAPVTTPATSAPVDTPAAKPEGAATETNPTPEKK